MIKKIIIFLYFLLAITICTIALKCCMTDCTVVAYTSGGKVHKDLQGEKFERALRYHGIHDFDVKRDKENKIWVFYRDGKKCELFKYLENEK